MTKRSASRFRGWNYALVIALSLVGLFGAGEYVSNARRASSETSPRTTTLMVSLRPGNTSRIVGEPLPMEPEPPRQWLERSEWADYKSDPPASIGMLDPPAGARLIAPISVGSLEDGVEDWGTSRLVLGDEPARDAIAAMPASTSASWSARPPLGEPTTSNAKVGMWSRQWPRTPQIDVEISELREQEGVEIPPEVSEWLDRIESTLARLRENELSSPNSAGLLQSLTELSDSGIALSRTAGLSPTLARGVARLGYSLQRRGDVWTSVHRCVQNSREYVAPREYRVDLDRIAERMEIARDMLRTTEDLSGWTRYLMLDQVEALVAGQMASRDSQVAFARRFLSRVTDLRVSPEQLRVLKSEPIHRLADSIHPLTIKPVDYRKLLTDIEAVESQSVHRCSQDLADAIQSLRFSEHPELGEISSALNTHYRNANVRLSVSKEFINRMIPRGQVTSRPVEQRILGADTRGASRVTTDLAVDLVPDPAAWRILLNLDGDIHSNTRSSRSGATFFNSSSAHVQSSREIRIDARSLTINGNPATVESSDSLRRFSTTWDDLPIVGDMIRYVAHQEFLQSRPVARRITQRLIAQQTDEEMDRQLQTRVSDAQEKFDRRLLGPLQGLDLNPMVLDMQTTADRLVARYRVAGLEQLSSFTPRPLAPADSLVAVQLHQSVLNNLVNQAIDTSRDWTIRSLADSIADLLQQPRPTLPEDTPSDVTIRFMDLHPISVEFEEGRMWLTLRIASLEQPGRIQLKNFTIRTSYLASADGLQAELARDGVISIDGHRIGVRDRLPLRAIFTKVFSGRSSLPMVAESLLRDPRAQGLIVSQLELRDGWLAISISPSPEASEKVASRSSEGHESRRD